ncbi:hypothetical protein [Anaplasma bovis]|uniref:hypothetical protein n=1 Tax=Anaplasma bovis TaxID=186733 RepID=UPI002FF0AB93
MHDVSSAVNILDPTKGVDGEILCNNNSNEAVDSGGKDKAACASQHGSNNKKLSETYTDPLHTGALSDSVGAESAKHISSKMASTNLNKD